ERKLGVPPRRRDRGDRCVAAERDWWPGVARRDRDADDVSRRPCRLHAGLQNRGRRSRRFRVDVTRTRRSAAEACFIAWRSFLRLVRHVAGCGDWFEEPAAGLVRARAATAIPKRSTNGPDVPGASRGRGNWVRSLPR